MLKLTIKDLMTEDIIIYDEHFINEILKFCRTYDITNIPSPGYPTHHYTLDKTSLKFTKGKTTEDMLIDANSGAFDPEVFEKFKKHDVLFVVEHGLLAGVIHYSDYNKSVFHSQVYTLVLRLEKSLRDYIRQRVYTADDMLRFFQEQNTEHYTKKAKDFQKHMSKPANPFEAVDLRDLVGLLNSKRIHVREKIVPDRIGELRNTIMHGKSTIRHANVGLGVLYEKEDLFKTKDLVLELIDSIRRVETLFTISRIDTDQESQIQK